MTFKEELKLALRGKLPDAHLELLPAGFNQVGHLAMLRLDQRLLSKATLIGQAVMSIYPRVRSVCLEQGIRGETRKPKIRFLAGDKAFETVHIENGVKYKLDVSKIMWSKGNKNERKRILKFVKPGETVVDCFAGIGYFSLQVARHTHAASIIAMELSPEAFRYLTENIRLNRLTNVRPRLGDCRELARSYEGRADRVIMGYLKNTERFFPAALKIAKEGGVIHFHDLCREDEIPARLDRLKEIAARAGHFLDILDIQQVKGYAPRLYHFVYDIKKL